MNPPTRQSDEQCICLQPCGSGICCIVLTSLSRESVRNYKFRRLTNLELSQPGSDSIQEEFPKKFDALIGFRESDVGYRLPPAQIVAIKK